MARAAHENHQARAAGMTNGRVCRPLFRRAQLRLKDRDPGLLASIADRFPSRFADSEIGKLREAWTSRPIYSAAETVLVEAVLLSAASAADSADP